MIQAPSTAPGVPKGEVASSRTDDFAARLPFLDGGRPPVVAPQPTHRALCFDAFAILHSGENQTAVYVAQKLNRALVLQAPWATK